MRVLFVTTSFPPEAQSGRAAELAALFERVRDWAEAALVVTGTRDAGAVPQPVGAERSVPRDGVVTVQTWRSSTLRKLQVWRKAHEVGRAFEPHVVVIGGLSIPPLPWPTVRIVRDLVDAFGRPTLVGPGPRLSARNADVLVVPSTLVRQRVFDLGIDRWRVARLPVAVPDDEAVAVPHGGTPVRLVHPGSVQLPKGQHISVDAVSRLPPEFKAMVALAIVGPVVDDRFAGQLRVAARRQPVTFPEVSIAEAIGGAHAVVCPASAPPGFPDTEVRAMAMGRLVLWADHPSSRDVLGEIGLAVKPEPRALRRVLLDLLPTVDWAAEGARARAFAVERYGWGKLWPQWRDLLARYA